MEGGSALATWIAYAVICLFVLLALFIVLRSAMFFSLLLLMPLARLFGWLPPVRRWLERRARPEA